MKSTRLGALAAAIAMTMAFAAVALAVQTPIEDVELEAAGGDAIFDPGNSEGDCLGEVMYTPVSDGSFEAQTDAFDAGLTLSVNGHGFRDTDDEGDLVGQQLTVGPTNLGPVQVTRTDRALSGSSTLRDLVRLKNTTKKRREVSVTLDTNLGSDSSTEVRASSNGDSVLTKGDRWIVTSDDADDPGDPPVTHVFYGKGKKVASKPVAAAGAIAFDDSGGECLFASFDVKLKKRGTAYLLFFAELHGTNESAISDVAKFNRKKLNAALKDGLKKSVRKKIANWDLAPKKKGKKK